MGIRGSVNLRFYQAFARVTCRLATQTQKRCSRALQKGSGNLIPPPTTRRHTHPPHRPPPPTRDPPPSYHHTHTTHPPPSSSGPLLCAKRFTESFNILCTKDALCSHIFFYSRDPSEKDTGLSYGIYYTG